MENVLYVCEGKNKETMYIDTVILGSQLSTAPFILVSGTQV